MESFVVSGRLRRDKIAECNPGLTAELDRMAAEVEIEDGLAEASEQMEIAEIFDGIDARGEQYADSYKDGWWDALLFYTEHGLLRAESLRHKNESLRKRLGLA